MAGRPPSGAADQRLGVVDNNVTIYRAATETEYDEFLALMLEHMAAYIEGVLSLLGMTVGQFAEHLRTVGQVWAILSQGQTAGFYWLEERGPEVHLHGLMIKPDFQGRGLGTLTLQRLADQYQGRKAFIELGVHQENERAIRLYQRLGYRVVARRDELGFNVMRLELAHHQGKE